MEYACYDEAEELRLMAQDSEEAFNMIFMRHSAKVYGMAFSCLKEKALAEEVLQEVFLYIWEKRKDLIMVENLGGYLCTISKRLSWSSLQQIAKREAAKKEYLADLKTPDLSPSYLTNMTEEVKKAVEHLPPQQKKIFHMAKVEGLSYDAIATKLNISPRTVSTHLTTAFASIRKMVPGSFILLLFMNRLP